MDNKIKILVVTLIALVCFSIFYSYTNTIEYKYEQRTNHLQEMALKFHNYTEEERLEFVKNTPEADRNMLYDYYNYEFIKPGPRPNRK